MLEYKDPNPVWHAAAVARFALAASQCGLIRPGDKLDRNLNEFALNVVEMCASIGDQCFDHRTYISAGEQIRAELTGC